MAKRKRDRTPASDDEPQCDPREETPRRDRRRHYSVYVVYLRNPSGDGRAGYYVGMTGLSPEERFANHKAGVKAVRVVKWFGERLVPRLYEQHNPMTFAEAVEA